jgi:hypothetical protein
MWRLVAESDNLGMIASIGSEAEPLQQLLSIAVLARFRLRPSIGLSTLGLARLVATKRRRVLTVDTMRVEDVHTRP